MVPRRRLHWEQIMGGERGKNIPLGDSKVPLLIEQRETGKCHA